MLDLRVSDTDHPDARALDVAVQAYYAEVYGDQDTTPMRPDEFRPPSGVFLLGYDDGRPVVSGGWRAVDADPTGGEALRPGDAEIKRMYVVPDARGRGHARGLLSALERTAATSGRRRMVLETGELQPEAVALYTSCGYVRIDRFGVYRSDPRSLCFAKPLADVSPGTVTG